MEINNSQFLNYTVNRKITSDEVSKVANFVSVTENVPTLNSAPLENEISIESVGSTISDEALEKLYSAASVTTVSNPTTNSAKLSTSYRSFSPAEIMQIKTVIYNLHNGGETPTPDPTPDPTPTNSFVSSFVDVDTMFDYLNKVDSSITKESGITKAQLVALTQDDDWEDANYDFFGSLNRIFDVLDVDDDASLSYQEIKDFIGEELGSNFNDYYDKVNSYSDKIQDEYEKMSSQEKLEFAIDKAREYLEASGLTDQLDALDRLLDQEDMFNDIKVGNIAIADLNKNNTSGYTNLGAYNYYITNTNYPYTTKDGVSGEYKIWKFDEDFVDAKNGNQDLGITLDVSLLDGSWYDLVNTLVHELTHATAFKYYIQTNDGVSISRDVIDTLHDKGALSDKEYHFFVDDDYEHWNNLSSSDVTEEESEMYNRLKYLLYEQWGEYAAYQVDADYNDSIGQDVYYRDGDNTTTAVDGKNEKQAIDDHIKASYKNELPPDYKWWSYA